MCEGAADYLSTVGAVSQRGRKWVCSMLPGDVPDSIAAVGAKLYGISCSEPEVSLLKGVFIHKRGQAVEDPRF